LVKTSETTWRQNRRRAPSGASPGSLATDSIQITAAQYKKLGNLVYQLSGIYLGDQKRELLRARLAKRFRALNINSVQQYIQILQNDKTGQELVNFLDVITTNKTDFFREPQHFDFLAREALPNLDKMCGPNETVRIWSAACSSGEEPYTIAIVVQENRAALGRRDVSILASDLSTQVLQRAQRGIYAKERVAGIPRQLMMRYFQRGSGQWEGHVRVKAPLRAMVNFARINLMDPFNFSKPFHFIFCRNVMIYFDKNTVEQLVGKFYRCLVPGGFLFVGHSESLAGISHDFKFVQPATYIKRS